VHDRIGRRFADDQRGSVASRIVDAPVLAGLTSHRACRPRRGRPVAAPETGAPDPAGSARSSALRRSAASGTICVTYDRCSWSTRRGGYRSAMAGRPTLAWRREHPHERLVMAYTDAYTNLGIAYSERPPFGAKTDSEEVRQFLEKLTQANLSLRLLRVLCHGPVRPAIDAAIKEVDQAVRAPITKTFYRDPSPWLIASIECVEEAARRDVQLILRK
jgi:hypothetical protein